MKKIMLISAAAALSLAAACTKDAVREINPETLISFNGFIGHARTKGTVVTSGNKATALNDYRVHATTHDNGSETYMDVKVDAKTNKYSDLPYYWPNSPKTLDFFAITPDLSNSVTYSNSSGEKKVTISAFQADTEYARQQDLMLALSTDINNGQNGNAVELAFRHALSQITFKANVTHYVSVSVKAITIHNVCSQADILMDGTAFSAENLAERRSYTMTFAEPISVNSATGMVDLTTGTDQAFILIPQQLTGWAEGNTTDQADAAGQSYLEILCSIQNLADHSYILGSEAAPASTYVPFGTSWNPGLHYIYTLRFGVGMDKNRNTLRKPIEFLTQVTDWTSAGTAGTLLNL